MARQNVLPTQRFVTLLSSYPVRNSGACRLRDPQYRIQAVTTFREAGPICRTVPSGDPTLARSHALARHPPRPRPTTSEPPVFSCSFGCCPQERRWRPRAPVPGWHSATARSAACARPPHDRPLPRSPVPPATGIPGDVGMEPLRDRAFRLQFQPAPGHLDHVLPDMRGAGLADAKIVVDISARPRHPTSTRPQLPQLPAIAEVPIEHLASQQCGVIEGRCRGCA